VNLPALVDIEHGTVTPMIQPQLIQRALNGDRTLVKAVLTGPVVKVQNATDCLYVRSAPSTAAPTMGCYPDGTLLVDRQDTRHTDGKTWVAVNTLEGAPGWASADYLDTAGRDMGDHSAGYPAGTRTGNTDVDPVIAALEPGDPGKEADAVSYTKVACALHPSGGTPQPPQCPEGVADGTPVDVLPVLSCEGTYRLRADVESNGFPGVEKLQLYAVIRSQGETQSSDWSAGQYEIVYTDPATGFARAFYVTDGKIVGDWGGCGAHGQDILKDVPSSDIILPPPG
jgi:hypothetical protein